MVPGYRKNGDFSVYIDQVVMPEGIVNWEATYCCISGNRCGALGKSSFLKRKCRAWYILWLSDEPRVYQYDPVLSKDPDDLLPIRVRKANLDRNLILFPERKAPIASVNLKTLAVDAATVCYS